MDPLSVTAAVVTFCGVINQATICCQKLRALRKAPKELELLLEEVGGLKDLLHEIEPIERAAPVASRGYVARNGHGLGGPVAGGLHQHLERASCKLRELESLVQDCAHGQVRFGIDRGHLAWAGRRSKANSLREDLSGLRLNLATSLQTKHWHQGSRIESALNEVTAQQHATTKSISTVQDWLTSQFALPPPSFQSISQSISVQSHFSVEAPVKGDQCSTRPLNQPTATTMTRLQKSQPAGANHTLQLCIPESSAHCKAWCSCLCHSKNVMRVKQPFGRAVGGSFSLAYSGLPFVTAECDQKSCRSRSQPSAYMTIQFPAWLWQRCVTTSMDYDPLAGPNLNVRMPRVVGWESKLWKYGPSSDIAAIQKLYSAKIASPWDVSPLGGNALHYAAGHGEFEMCRFLISQGALKDQEDGFCNTATSLAWDQILAKSLPKHEEQLAVHLFESADYLQSRQFTVLHKIVLGLIPKDLATELEYSTKEINHQDSNGRTCVSWAAARGDIKFLKTLLEHGADPSLPDVQGSTPMHHVRNRECCEILLQHKASVSARNKYGHTPLHAVTRGKGSLPLLEILIASGADVNAADYSCETALCNGNVAIEKHIKCVRYLIDAGADIEAATDSQDTLLHLATIWDAHDIMSLLLHAGADYTRTNRYGQNILHLAARMSNPETMSIFSAHGLRDIDLQAADCEGKTVLEHAAEREDAASASAFRDAFDALLHRQQARQEKQQLASQGSQTVVAVAELVSEMAAVDLSKGGSVVRLMPLGMNDDDDDYNDNDDDEILDENERCNFHEAVEYIEADALLMGERTGAMEIIV